MADDLKHQMPETAAPEGDARPAASPQDGLGTIRSYLIQGLR